MNRIIPTPGASHPAWLHTLWQSLPQAAIAMLAAIATLLCTLALAPATGPAVLAVVLSLSLSRSQLDRDRRGRIEAAIALPIVSVAAVGVGLLLLHAPWTGAAVFVGGMFVSIWLRRFGPMARRAGSLIALPFVTLLVAPHIAPSQAGHIPAWLLPILIALLALLWVSVLDALAQRLRWLLPMPVAVRARAAVATHPPSPHPGVAAPLPASTRMAVQMALALALSFVVGYVFFAERWAWIVLTAFIVNSGNRGRLDVAYKSVLRVLGAAAGTLAALVLSAHVGGHGAAAAVAILLAVFLGVWLRPLNYAWWALCITVALALLQGFDAVPALRMLALRLEEIVIGALIGVATAWFVLPVRSTDVLRRRLADALAALATALTPADAAATADDFEVALADVERLAPAFRAARWLAHRSRLLQPAEWVDALLACRPQAVALIERGGASAEVRRAIGDARRALRTPEHLAPALEHLRDVLSG
jgi:hypothetical protein